MLFLKIWLDLILKSSLRVLSKPRVWFNIAINGTFIAMMLGFLVVILTNEWKWFFFCSGTGVVLFTSTCVWFGIRIVSLLRASRAKCTSSAGGDNGSIKSVLFKIQLFMLVDISLSSSATISYYAVFFFSEIEDMSWLIFYVVVVPCAIAVHVGVIGIFIHGSRQRRSGNKVLDSSSKPAVDSSIASGAGTSFPAGGGFSGGAVNSAMVVPVPAAPAVYTRAAAATTTTTTILC